MLSSLTLTGPPPSLFWLAALATLDFGVHYLAGAHQVRPSLSSSRILISRERTRLFPQNVIVGLTDTMDSPTESSASQSEVEEDLPPILRLSGGLLKEIALSLESSPSEWPHSAASTLRRQLIRVFLQRTLRTCSR